MRREHWLIALSVLILCAAGGYYLYNNAHYVWRAQVNSANLHGEKKMLAATRLLKAHGHNITEAETMHDALRSELPNGTLFITNNQGFLLPAQVKQVQAWVEKGNTLIMLPTNPQKFKAKAKRNTETENGQGKEEVDEEKEERKRLAREEKKKRKIIPLPHHYQAKKAAPKAA